MYIRLTFAAGAAALSASAVAWACDAHGTSTPVSVLERMPNIPCCLDSDQLLAGAVIHTATTPTRLPFNSLNVELLSNVPLANMGGGSGSSLYGWTDPLTRREYAIMGRSNGTAFIDVTDPFNPLYVANLPVAAGSVATSWREPKVYGNHAYIGVDRTTHPMQVVDLTRLRGYAGTTMTLTADRNFSNVNKIHTIAVNHESGYLYQCGTEKYSGGLVAVDVRNPGNPIEVGGFAGDGYTHETQVVIYRGPDSQYQGREIAFNSNAKSGSAVDTFSIVDVTNKSAMNRLASKSYNGAQWIHQGWLTEDHRYFIQNDEYDEVNGAAGTRTRTHLWDVSDLDNPIYRGFYQHQTVSPDHNLYVKDGYVYQTNYTAGLRILKIGDLSSTNSSQWLTEVGFFDTYQPDDGASFNGAWNNYPYFASGNIIVSDINGGLFVLRATNVPEPAAGLLVGMIGLMIRRRR